MRERDIQTLFGKWLQAHPRPTSAVYELKLCKSSCLPFKAVAEHQLTALLAVRGAGLYHKISDSMVHDRSLGFRFPSKKPFDCLWLNNISAYIVVLFYTPRAEKVLHFIGVEEWVKEVNESTRKSLTPKRASEIATFRAVL